MSRPTRTLLPASSPIAAWKAISKPVSEPFGGALFPPPPVLPVPPWVGPWLSPGPPEPEEFEPELAGLSPLSPVEQLVEPGS